MDYDFSFLYAAAATVVGLAAAAVPMAARGARPRAWWGHAGLAILVALSASEVTYRLMYGGEIPRATIYPVVLAGEVLPVILAGACARAAVRRWPARRWLAATVAVIAAFVLTVAAVHYATRGALPDIIRATT